MNEQQAMKAIGRLDQMIAQINTGRQQHALLAQDVQAIQERVKQSFLQAATIEGQADEIKWLEDKVAELTEKLPTIIPVKEMENGGTD